MMKHFGPNQCLNGPTTAKAMLVTGTPAQCLPGVCQTGLTDYVISLSGKWPIDSDSVMSWIRLTNQISNLVT